MAFVCTSASMANDYTARILKVIIMNKCCNENLSKALELADSLLVLADAGDRLREDVGCGVLFGSIRDSAYKIRALAETEIAEHKSRGSWQSAAAGNSARLK